MAALLGSGLPFVLAQGLPRPVPETHWARWQRGPMVAVLVDPGSADWDLVAELSIPAILVHSKPFDSPELAERAGDRGQRAGRGRPDRRHFLSVLRMVSQGYLVVDSMPMRPLIEAVGRQMGRARARPGRSCPS